MKKILLVGVALAALSACKDERPPRWGSKCVEMTSTVTIIPIYNGTTMIMTPVTSTHCVRSERVCLPAGEDYMGHLTDCS